MSERLFVDFDKIKADDKEGDRRDDDIGKRRRDGIGGDIANAKTDDGVDKLHHRQWSENTILHINVLWYLKSQHPS